MPTLNVDHYLKIVGNKSSSRVNTAKIRMQRDKYGIYHQEELYTHKEKMAPMALSDSEVKTCSKSCLKNYEALKKQYDGFKHEVLFSEEIALLKRSVGCKEYELGLLRTELEKVKQEKEGVDFKIAKFDKSAKDLNEMLESQITDKKTKEERSLEEFKEPEVNEYGPRNSSLKPTTGCDKESDNSKENTDDSLEQHQMTDTQTSSFESPLKVDKDWKEKFFYPANHVESVEGCGSNTSKNVSEVEPKKVRKNNDAPIIKDWVSDDEEQDGSKTKPEKKTVIPTAAKIEKPVRKPVKYAEMYRSQRPRGNQRNWNGQKSNQLGCNFVFNNKACFICESFDHIQYSCPNQQRKRIVSGNNYNKKDNDYYSKTSHPSAHKHMAPRAVLMKTGLKSFNTARPVNTVRSVNTGRPFSTARSFNTVRPFYTAHPKSTTHCARPRTYFQNQAQSTVHRPFLTSNNINKNSTICIIENPVQHSKTKHIEIRHHFIRDCNAKKLIQMAKIDTEHNVADLLTKGFDAGRFQYLVSSIGMLNP
ncbi:hypothetical protein Tco_0403802 [Tanacetum coccineum]